MLVSELIEKLKTMPSDAWVISGFGESMSVINVDVTLEHNQKIYIGPAEIVTERTLEEEYEGDFELVYEGDIVHIK